MGYTSPELSPSFLPAHIIPSVDEDDARTAAMPTHERAELSAPPALPASSMQATVFGVQRISPAPAGLSGPARPSPAPPVAQHLAPAVRAAPPPPPAPPVRSAAPPPASGLSAAAAALADQPTGFLRLPDALGGGPTPVGSRGAASGAAPGASWLADQPTSWVALQPGSTDTSAPTPASAAPSATAVRRSRAAAPALAASGSSSLRPWLLSLGIGLLGGLAALVLILSAMRYLSSGKSSPSTERSRASEAGSASRGREVSERAPTVLPAIALDEAMRAVQRGDLERAIAVLKQARERETGSTAALDSLIDSLRRVRNNRLP